MEEKERPVRTEKEAKRSCLILTGMSGAGKTVALKILEDFGFNCIDNLPVALLDKFLELVMENGREEQIALGIDSRNIQDLDGLEEHLSRWEEKISFQIVFLDAKDEVLIQRFKETRRSHPLSKEGRVETGIISERKKLAFLRKKADIIIDTSKLLTKELRSQLFSIFLKKKKYKNLQLSIVSFGFKYGIPEDLDLLFDVRFLPNPYYEKDLKAHTGMEEMIQKFVYQDGNAEIFLHKLKALLDFLIPLYISEGKNQLVIGIACTGGKHRSVTIAEKLYQSIKDMENIGVRLDHRDINK